MMIKLHTFQRYYYALFFILVSIFGWGQSYLGLNGGFEGTATIDNTNVYTVGQSGKWTKANSSQTIANETSVIRSGANSLRVNNSTTTGRRVFTPIFTTTTGQRLVIQFYRRSGNTTNTQQSQNMISFDAATNGEATSGTYSAVTAANSWEKVTYAPTNTTSSTNLWGGILNRQTGTGGDMFIDDVVIYISSAVDTTAPNAPTVPVFSGQTSTTIPVSWTAASGGVDNGGYLVVRDTSDPTTAPNVNGIYAVGNTIGTEVLLFIKGQEQVLQILV